MRPEDSLLSQLSERDRRESQIAPGTPDGPFRLLYQFPGEALSEIRNATPALLGRIRRAWIARYHSEVFS